MNWFSNHKLKIVLMYSLPLHLFSSPLFRFYIKDCSLSTVYVAKAVFKRQRRWCFWNFLLGSQQPPTQQHCMHCCCCSIVLALTWQHYLFWYRGGESERAKERKKRIAWSKMRIRCAHEWKSSLSFCVWFYEWKMFINCQLNLHIHTHLGDV